MGVLNAGTDDEDFRKATGGHDRHVVVVDDAELMDGTSLEDTLSGVV